MKFGNLTVIEKSFKNNEGRWKYRCLCDCGNECFRAMNSLKYIESPSCGCMRGKNKKHGLKGTRVYRIWSGMKNRCTNKNSKDYTKYSRLGLCRRWMKFEAFLEDMGEPPTKNHSIDRIDNSKGYSKSNCKWSTDSQQQRNKSKSKVWIVDGVEFESLQDVADMHSTSKPVVSRWFNGYISRGKQYPPRKGFEYRYKYESN